MTRWEVDHEWNWTWWTFGARYVAEYYCAREWLIGLGPLLIIVRDQSTAA